MSTFNYTVMGADAFNNMMNGTGINYTSMYHKATNPNTSNATPYWNPTTQKYMTENDFFQGFESESTYFKEMENLAMQLEGKEDTTAQASANVGQGSNVSSSVNMPTASPRPFSPIQLSSAGNDEMVMGLLNSPLLNKGLLT